MRDLPQKREGCTRARVLLIWDLPGEKGEEFPFLSVRPIFPRRERYDGESGERSNMREGRVIQDMNRPFIMDA